MTALTLDTHTNAHTQMRRHTFPCARTHTRTDRAKHRHTRTHARKVLPRRTSATLSSLKPLNIARLQLCSASCPHRPGKDTSYQAEEWGGKPWAGGCWGGHGAKGMREG